jgi:hypothetical protein
MGSEQSKRQLESMRAEISALIGDTIERIAAIDHLLDHEYPNRATIAQLRSQILTNKSELDSLRQRYLALVQKNEPS